jgi:oligopeptide/dipeptide ABC transporter ATP-binding protein
MSTVLEVRDLRTEIHLRHGVLRAIDGLSLSIEAGETVGLVGESGSGKTMTGLSIMQLLPSGGRIAAGSIVVNGRELVGLPESKLQEIRGNDVGMIFQDPMTSLNPTMRIGKQIAEVVQLHRPVGKREATERAVEVLSQVGVPQPRERLGYFPHQLSGGLRQRVMIAMALACDPQVLIADEPTTALDVTIQAQILALLDTLRQELGMGILLITHDMGVIAGHADRVEVMYAGRIVEEAVTVDLFEQRQHRYTEALLDSIPDPEQDRSIPLYSIPGLPPSLVSPPAGCRFAPRCRYASDRCRTELPELVAADEGHRFACFHPVDPAAGADRHHVAQHRHGGETEHRLRPQDVGAVASGAEPEPVKEQDAAQPHTREPLLIIDGLGKEFPITRGVLQRTVATVKAVSDVSFGVGRGETFGLVGESGCGKSTVARMLVGLERPTSGTVRFDGSDLTALLRRGVRNRAATRGARRELQLMFQDPYASLDPRMRIEAILREPLAIQSLGERDTQKARVAELLEEVGLSRTAADRYPHEFSGGQRQRIGLARALILEPTLLIADEPVSALDVSIRSQILNLMLEIQARRNLTYIIISHDLGVVRYMADRIGVMYLGKLVEIGPSREVYKRVVHPYTAGLIEAIPNPDPRRERRKPSPQVTGEPPSAVNPPSGCRFRTRCRFATEICAEVEPPLVRYGPDHLAACHHPLRSPVAQEPEVPPVRASAAS